MQVSEVFLAGGDSQFSSLLRRVSMSRLRTYQIYEHIKVRTRLPKLNSDSLKRAAPRLWERIQGHDEDLASDLSQAILVSNLDLIIEALNLLGIPHQDGFFSKDADIKQHLQDGWQQKAFDALKSKYPPEVITFYLNHLGAETGAASELFQPAA